MHGRCSLTKSDLQPPAVPTEGRGRMGASSIIDTKPVASGRERRDLRNPPLQLLSARRPGERQGGSRARAAHSAVPDNCVGADSPNLWRPSMSKISVPRTSGMGPCRGRSSKWGGPSKGQTWRFMSSLSLWQPSKSSKVLSKPVVEDLPWQQAHVARCQRGKICEARAIPSTSSTPARACQVTAASQKAPVGPGVC